MNYDLLKEISRRIANDFGLKKGKKDKWLQGGTCPVCKHKELYANAEAPWVLYCGRLDKCGASIYIKEEYRELFDDWSARYQRTEADPVAAARAYLEFSRGFDPSMIKGWYSQETYHDRKLNIASETVRFALPGGGHWERLIDRPARFGKKKAMFKYGSDYQGRWWIPPCIDPMEVKQLWIVEGIFDAIALLHAGISAVSIMSCNNYPGTELAALAELCTANGKRRPELVWALDGDNAGQRYTKKWAAQAEKDGWSCVAAQIPFREEKRDWNDLWLAKRLEKEHLEEYRYHGNLLLAKNASEKGLLMYTWREQHEFYFTFDNRMYWFKLDLGKYNKAMEDLQNSEDPTIRVANSDQLRERALEQSGGVVQIANCSPRALYFQRNEVTDESWYYFRVDFPHDGGSVKNTFTGAQVAAVGEFTKRLLSVAAGAMFTGSPLQLQRIMQDQLYNIKTVQTIDYIGYSKEYQAYLLGDLAVKGGQLFKANNEDFFEFGKLRLKSLLKTIPIDANTNDATYQADWFNHLWTCFGAKGVIALAFWTGSLFVEQIRERYASFPFLEATGEAGAGKSTLLQFLWKLLGRDYEGFDPSKSSVAGRSRAMGQVSGMPVVLLEGDRSDPDKAHAKSFDWDELKDFFGGGTLRTRGQKTGGNETYEPPFRGSICISQNASVVASEAIMTRIVKLHFVRPVVTEQSRASADTLNMLQIEDVSHYLIKALKAEASILATFAERVTHYETEFRAMRQVRVERIGKNHAQIMALVECLQQLTPITRAQLDEVYVTLRQMAEQRQESINADPSEVAEFWEVYDYLQSTSQDPVVNHAADPGLIAINLNEFAKLAANHRQPLAELKDLRRLLKDSRTHKYIDTRPVHSVIRSRQPNDAFEARESKPTTVKCWVFKAGTDSK
ncbi:toprim domain-containing protein [Pseudomonas abyssi]|uniref:toprim domain-containing protein n=1 Tax=Pseudomonas abyssi TaxID=170540 RepID=UPI000E52F025|nr:toprim domain-containing protein [Halopseudomonas gallaeciensis]